MNNPDIFSAPPSETRLKIALAEPEKLNAAFEELLNAPEIPCEHKLVLAADCFRRWGDLDVRQRAACARAAADSGLDPFRNFPYCSIPDPDQPQDAQGKSPKQRPKQPFEASLAYWAGFSFSPSEYDILLAGRYQETYCNGIFPNIASAVAAKNRDMVRHLLALGAELEYDEPASRSGEPGRKAHAIELATQHYDPCIFEDFIDRCSPSILTRKFRHGQSLLNYLTAKDCHGSFQIVKRRLARDDLLALLDYEHDIYKQKTIHYAFKTIDTSDIGTEKIVMELLDLYGDDIWPKDPDAAARLAHVAVQQLSVPSIKKILSPERINAVCSNNRQALFYALSQQSEDKIRFLLDMGQDPFRNAGDSRWDYDWNPFEHMLDNAAYIRPRTYCHILLSHPNVDPFKPRRIFDETVCLADFVEKRYPDMSDYFEDWKLMVQSRKDSQELGCLPSPQNPPPKKPAL